MVEVVVEQVLSERLLFLAVAAMVAQARPLVFLAHQ
jgi:hypothetical protein